MARHASRIPPLLAVVLAGLCGFSCTQTFEPDGPAGDRLIVYAILSSERDVQYVRLSATHDKGAASPAPAGASVTMRPAGASGPTVVFHDTLVDHVDARGNVEQLPVYVAEHFRPVEGATYELEVRTASGNAAARAQATALGAPRLAVYSTSFSQKSSKPVVATASFRSIRGSFVLHLYVEYYAFLGNAWRLEREEVADRSYVDDAGQKVLVYPQLRPVSAAANTNAPSAEITFDSTEYHAAFARAAGKFQGNVVFVDALLILTQVDETLYSYYVVNNFNTGDLSSLRMDVPEFTNIDGGWGVFGSSVTATYSYSLLEGMLPAGGIGAMRRPAGPSR